MRRSIHVMIEQCLYRQWLLWKEGIPTSLRAV